MVSVVWLHVFTISPTAAHLASAAIGVLALVTVGGHLVTALPIAANRFALVATP